jgi:biotin carboxyl carrier protein
MLYLASAAGARPALLVALLAVAATCPAALAADNLVSLSPAQRANARIEVLRLEDSATTPSSGLTVTGRVAAGGAARALVTSPVAARIAAVAAHPGASVRRGDALLTLAGPEVAALQRTLREAEAAATVASQRLARERRLLDEGVIAASRVEQSEAAATAAQAQLRQVRASLPGFEARGTDGQVVVRAGVDGVLAGPRLAAGAAVAAGDTLAIIGAAGRLRVALAASPGVARALAAGDSLLVRSRGCEARAVLRAVGTAADANQAVPLDAEVLDAEGCLLPGEAVTAVLSPRSAAQGGWALPPRAFVRRGAETFVFVERAQGFEAVAVDPTAARAGYARGAALRAGDAVAITGSALLKGAWLGLAGEE